MTLHRFTFRAMAAVNEVQIHSDDARFAESAAARAIEEVLRIEAKYSMKASIDGLWAILERALER